MLKVLKYKILSFLLGLSIMLTFYLLFNVTFPWPWDTFMVSTNSPEYLGTLLLGSVAHQLPGSEGHKNQSPLYPVPKFQLTESWRPQMDCNLHVGRCLVPGQEVGDRLTPARLSVARMGTATTMLCLGIQT